MSASIFTSRVVSIDLEGDGNPDPEPVELSIVPVSENGVGHAVTWLIDPGREISPRVSRIHGIWRAQLTGAPYFEDIAERVLDMLEGSIIIGHNVSVDMRVIRRKIPDVDPIRTIDTLKLAKHLLPNEDSFSLSSLASSLMLPIPAVTGDQRRQHSAEYDATVTAHLLLKLISIADRNVEESLDLATIDGVPSSSPRLI